MKRPSIVLSCVLLSFCTLVSVSWSAPTTEQRKELRTLKTEVTKASNYIKQGKIQESAKVVKSVQERLKSLQDANEAELAAELKDIYKKLAHSHGILELEGLTMPALGNAPMAPAMVAPGTLLPPPAIAPGAVTIPLNFPATNLSFTKHIAPVMIAKCGRCHVNRAQGNFSAANYATLIKGPPEGVVIFKGDPSGSRLIEVIESGDMPRGGTKVTANEMAALKTWIKEGAIYDGTDPTASLASLAPDAKVVEVPRLEVVESTGRETVSFSKDIAGVFAKRCVSCHNADNNDGNLSMQDFARFLRGGDSGAPFMVGKPAESLLIKKLRGTGDVLMPKRGGALDEEVIAKIEKWIAEGGKFDGETATASLQRDNEYAMAKIATHDELSKMRVDSSVQKWDLGFPGVMSPKVETKELLLFGNMGEGALQDYANESEAVISRVRGMLKAPANQPLVKGRMTLFLLKQRYDYTEFSKMVESRTVPADWRGHWRYNVTDAYGTMILPSNDEYSFEALLAQQLAGSYVAGQGNKVPHWFSEGAARVIASRISPKDPRVVAWNNQLQSSVQAMQKPDDFIKAQLSAEQNDIVSYGFMKALMGKSNTFEAVLDSLRKGAPFDQAFASVIRATPEQAAASWAPGAASGR
ncbi:MAG: hypothetical protein COA78_25390 [Blastopirellula sp.]|nr:MAG: hypothetical protein COA78_25390 [Blastopirellula sp.]